MNENNELNDIILKKNSSAGSSKKIILAVATLGIILIIVIMLMNSLSSSGIDNLPKASLPPQPQTELSAPSTEQEPLFEDVEVEHEAESANQNLEQIAQKLKEESGAKNENAKANAAPLQNQTQEPKTKTEPVAKKTVQTQQAKAKTQPSKPTVSKSEVPKIDKLFEPVAAQKTPQKAPAKQAQTPATSASGSHYIQVGSFSKYEPNKNFLNSITSLGYNYRYQEANGVNKVLVGPFKTLDEARDARKVLRAKVEPGAFLTTLQ